MDQSEVLIDAGAKILSAEIGPLGFVFRIVERNKGSGGNFTVGQFQRGDRSITLWVRFALGGVSYKKGNVEAGHTVYMQALGKEEIASFPGFGDPIDGFRRLAQDWKFCESFFTNDGAAFVQLMKGYKCKPKPTGFGAILR